MVLDSRSVSSEEGTVGHVCKGTKELWQYYWQMEGTFVLATFKVVKGDSEKGIVLLSEGGQTIAQLEERDKH